MGAYKTESRFFGPIASALNGTSHVFVRDLELEAVIGVHKHEKLGPQPIRVNIDLTVREPLVPVDDQLRNVVDYEQIVAFVQEIVAEGHVKLVETLAERIASVCLGDDRILVARVRIEKLNAIAGARSVGIEIERVRTDG